MVDSFTRLWAKELPPKYGYTVNAIAPGPTATEGYLGAGKEALDISQPTIDPKKRLGMPKEIAYAVAFLCKEGAYWVNGEYLFINRCLYIN